MNTETKSKYKRYDEAFKKPAVEHWLVSGKPDNVNFLTKAEAAKWKRLTARPRRGPYFAGMKFYSRTIQALLLALLPVAGGGCVSEQHAEFRGTLACGTTATNSPSVQEIGADFQLLPPASAEALTGYGLSPSGVMIVFVHDRRKYVSHDYRLANDAVSAVYVSERGLRDDGTWMKFLGEDAVARDQSEGIHRLQGSFDVERWKSDLDFRIRLAMQSSGPDALKVDGILMAYDRWKFRPVQAAGLVLCSMGLMNEGPSHPKEPARP
jgi:hypothetical protein